MILDEVARAPLVTSDSNNGGVQTTTVLDTKTINLAADARAKVDTPMTGNGLHDDSHYEHRALLPDERYASRRR